jgi:carnitine-CoA ligase
VLGGDRNNVGYHLRAATERYGDRPFLTIDGVTMTFEEIDLATQRAANALCALGLHQGDHVAAVMGNSLDYVLAWLGAARAGIVFVPVNPSLKGDGLAELLEHSGSSLVISAPDVADQVVAACARLPEVREVLRATGDGPVLIGDAGDPGIELKAHDPMMVMYTSGTTGKPKGIEIDHGRCSAGRFILKAVGVEETDRIFTSLPLFHANAAIISFWGAFKMGLPLSVGRRFSASRHWDEVRAAGATVFNALGAMMPILYKQPPRTDDAVNPCRLVISGACPKDLWRPFEERFGVKLVECYGTAEGALTIAGPDAPLGSIGKPVNAEAKVVREDGTECNPNEIGELVTRPLGGSAKVSYYKNEEASEAKIAGGWLHTGDRVYKDPDGFLWFVDRGDHFIRRRGENISSVEVEAIVERHPAVIEAAAYGIPSEMGEDEVAVAVVAHRGATIDPADLVAFCAQHMASFQVPRFVRIVSELPKTDTHRAKKNVLATEGRVEGIFDRETSAKA